MRKYAVAALMAGMLAGSIGLAQGAQRLSAGGATSIPYGHLDLCKRYPQQCGAHRVMPPVALSDVRWGKMERINQSVNASVAPKSDQDNYGKRDYWTMPAKRMGDCEDYVLMKRARLLAQGFSASQLLITMVRNRGEAHIVLTVRTDKGDFVLDNLRNEILPVEKTGYNYVKMQAPNHSGRWVAISGHATEIASN
ncbi:transglutaminase-like cysteine peptidase [Phyllobacterium leguminum]|uniref:Putative transglutaminase-like cysteine proteinase n=1 Tax=Phyllobacterium leguminum TaxID=314237 RepID=A0A318TA04_9HYPH|nr:transglutaminase-like cysteine peptidase [Phyllobacterium leguminum]PYE87579.1 putative transglutaminase-like cysteine proteinase [Phyllobacterium leguminum]